MKASDTPSTWRTAAIVPACALAIYWTTFLCTPRLFLFPEAGETPGDIPEYAAALRGRPDVADARKHPLYLPLSRPLYRAANAVRRGCGVNRDTGALAFPGALFGAAAAAAGWLLFKKSGVRAALPAAFFCSFTYAFWLMASVTETYSLTACTVNLFLLCAAGGWDRSPRRWCGLGILAALSALSDMRSLLLLVIPCSLAFRSRGPDAPRRALPALAASGVALATTAVFSLCLLRSTGPGEEGTRGLIAWMRDYGERYLVAGSGVDFLRTLFIDSFSPLHAEGMARAGFIPRLVHYWCARVFLSCALFLTVSSARHISRRLRANASLQGIALWLGISIAANAAFAHGTQMQIAAPMAMPLLLLLLPGILDAWGGGAWGRRLLALAAITALLNNLVVLNETRIAWEMPSLARGGDDRVYLLPGEPERLGFLAQKGLSRLPSAERDGLRSLPASARADALERVLGALPEREGVEARDIAGRIRAARTLAQEAQR